MLHITDNEATELIMQASNININTDDIYRNQESDGSTVIIKINNNIINIIVMDDGMGEIPADYREVFWTYNIINEFTLHKGDEGYEEYPGELTDNMISKLMDLSNFNHIYRNINIFRSKDLNSAWIARTDPNYPRYEFKIFVEYNPNDQSYHIKKVKLEFIDNSTYKEGTYDYVNNQFIKHNDD